MGLKHNRTFYVPCMCALCVGFVSVPYRCALYVSSLCVAFICERIMCGRQAYFKPVVAEAVEPLIGGCALAGVLEMHA